MQKASLCGAFPKGGPMPGIDSTVLWALLLLLIGLGCIVLEMFIPSAGMLGVLAALALITSLVMGFASGPWAGVALTLAVTVLVPVVLALAVKYWPRTPLGKMIMLRRPRSPDDVLPDTEAYRGMRSLVGATGVAVSDMYPGGIVAIGNRQYEAIASGQSIEAGQAVKVVGLEMQRLMVRLDTSARSTGGPLPPASPGADVIAGLEDPFA
jgi:membrane-bound ClpP family serine protease